MLKQLVKQVVGTPFAVMCEWGPLPPTLYRPLALRLGRPEPVCWGNLRRLIPFSRKFGFDRGQPIDRYYIDQFLNDQRDDIRGQVMEIGDATYTRRFGGQRVTHSQVRHAQAGNPQATLVGDLVSGRGVPQAAFDCIILTQTLGFLEDVPQAIGTCFQALRPGGVVLATVAGISQISQYDMQRWGDYWRFTSLSAGKLFARSFGAPQVQVRTFGNVLAATAFLQGLSAGELRRRELDHHDPDYELLITVRARRTEAP